MGGVRLQMRGPVTRLGGVLRHAVTCPAPLVLLRQQAIAHLALQHTGDVFGVFSGDFLHAAVGNAAFHLGGYGRKRPYRTSPALK